MPAKSRVSKKASVRKPTIQQVIKSVRESLIKLAKLKHPDAIAVQVYRGGVRKAKCGHENLCALAQFVANQLPEGYTASVGGGSDISIMKGENYLSGDDVAPTDEKHQASLTGFIRKFDRKRYAFLSS